MRRGFLWILPLLALVVLCPCCVLAQPRLQKKAAPERLEVSPSEVRLDSRRAYRQLVVTGYFGGEARDLTGMVEVRAQKAGVIQVQGGRVSGMGEGKTTLLVSFGGRRV